MPKFLSFAQVWLSFIAGITLAASALFILWLHVHWNDPRIIGYLQAWLPFVFSLVFALTPNKYMRRRVGVMFRICIAVAGLVYSLILWHDRDLEASIARGSLESAVSDAVTESNKHSDGSMSALRQDLDQQLRGLNSGLTTGFSGLKPQPPKFAVLRFRFFDSPGDSVSMHGGPDGVFTLDFTVTNIADLPASQGDIWVEVCGSCAFAKDPTGFDKPNGVPEVVRHKNFNSLNPGVSLEKMTIEVKPPSPTIPSFEVAWRYSCGSCGKMEGPQIFTILVLPPHKVVPPKFNFN
jgi:hypothetical protein